MLRGETIVHRISFVFFRVFFKFLGMVLSVVILRHELWRND